MATQPYLAEIMIFGGNFAPRGWAACDGQLMSVAQNSALFSVLGTIYGGDGRNTFGLPDLRGRMPMHEGNGPGLTIQRLGQKGGEEKHTLNAQEMPSHTHAARAHDGDADAVSAVGNVMANETADPPAAFSKQPANAEMHASAISNTGQGMSHNNMPPFLAVTFCIALVGSYPSRN